MPLVIDRRQSLIAVAGLALSPTLPAAERTAPRGLFVAVGYGGRRLSSPDGTRWENDTEWAANGGDDPNCLFSVAFGKGKFVAVGGGAGKGHILTTRDGKDWKRMRTTNTRVVPIGFGNGKFVVGIGRDFESSDDGETWTRTGRLDFLGNIFFRRFAFGNGVFVFCGDCDGRPNPDPRNGWRATTADGSRVEAFTADLPNTRSVAFGAGRFVLVGEKGFRQTSADGRKWENAHEPAEDFQWVFWTGERFVLNGSKASYTSPDGLKWEKAGHPLPARPLCVGDGVLIGASWKTNLWKSADGLKWDRTSTAGTNAIEAAAYAVPAPAG